jgi:hypothetical protein
MVLEQGWLVDRPARIQGWVMVNRLIGWVVVNRLVVVMTSSVTHLVLNDHSTIPDTDTDKYHCIYCSCYIVEPSAVELGWTLIY